MRCPKCGYISFDHLEVCVKCKKNIKAVSDSLHGTVFQVQSPAFLQLQPRQEEDETAGGISEARNDGAEEYVDDDLEILIEEPQEKDRKIEFEEDAQDELKLESDQKPAEEEEDREIEIDFSQFDDPQNEESSLSEDEPTEELKEETFSLEMPEALADISDLAPPAKKVEAMEEPSPAAQKSATDHDLDELDFDLGLDDLDLKPVAGSPAETELALDDLDFSETLAQIPQKPAGKTGADMDEELNFDLDLGGLSIHKDQ